MSALINVLDIVVLLAHLYVSFYMLSADLHLWVDVFQLIAKLLVMLLEPIRRASANADRA